MAQEQTDVHMNLRELRDQSLRVAALFVCALGILWLFVVINPRISGLVPPPAAWVGSVALVVSGWLAHTLRVRVPRIASILLIAGMVTGAVCARLVFPAAGLIFFCLPIIFANALFDPKGLFIVAAIDLLAALAVGFAGGESITAAVTLVPITLAAWLSGRTLYTALEWAWQGYERAWHNQEIARERRAELLRALKALDEASYRLERTNYMLTLARDEAKEARRLKQQFVQTVSHELRTPLNLIVGFTELMTESPEHYDRPLGPSYQRDLNIVYRNACHLQSMVNDVLDLASIEAAHMSLVPEEIAVPKLVQDSVDTVRHLVEARGLALKTDVEPGLPALWGDPTRIRQVIFNLLNNAIRFTEHGSVAIRVRREGDTVVFAVQDTGVGIAPQDTAHIFQEFKQADGSTRRRYGGAGLGLSISRRFVEMHNGQIWVESELGAGSTFYFSLPVGEQDLIAPDNWQAPAKGRLSSLHVGQDPVMLIVTPSPSAIGLFSRYVHGCRTIGVTSMEQAREAAQALIPQIVVVDWACAAHTDRQAIEALGQAWGMPRTIFLACSLPGEESERRKLSVDGYLIKPISRQEIWDLLRRFGQEVYKILVVDDDQDFGLLVSRMLENNPMRRYQVVNAYNGREGLAMVDRYQPDLILLDLMLPDLDGFQLIERIRAMPDGRATPIVVVSAQETTDEPQSMGQTLILSKPEGLASRDIVHWVQNAVDAAITSLPTTPAQPKGLAPRQAFPETPSPRGKGPASFA